MTTVVLRGCRAAARLHRWVISCSCQEVPNTSMSSGYEVLHHNHVDVTPQSHGVRFRSVASEFWLRTRTGTGLGFSSWNGEFGGLDRRCYGASSVGNSETDGETIASQIIGYATSCRKDEAAQVEVIRVLEQGFNFLLSQGPVAANAAGKVLLTLATLQVDGAKLSDAVDILQQTVNLEAASTEVRVSACEALVGVFLRMHKDSDALTTAHKSVKLVMEAHELPLSFTQELQFRAAATLQFVEHATISKKTGSLLDLSSLSSWLNNKEAHVDGVAAAILGLAECAHMRAQLSQAKDLYEKAAALGESSLNKQQLGLSSGAMSSQEVLMGALAGLGQVASHAGDYDKAEANLTTALNYAEQISGDKHPRVGAVLACLADVYARRGKARGTGDLTLTEGLYRKAIELLGAPLPDDPGSGMTLDLSDVTALARARYGTFLSHMKKRESEAKKLQTWASATWKGHHPLADILAQEASIPPTVGSLESSKRETSDGACIVIDVRLGRVF